MNSKEFKAKIEYYVISLSFTVLAVAVQTVGTKTIYKFDDEAFKNILYHYEFPSWICFSLSGLIGIVKLLKISKLLYLTEQSDDILNERINNEIPRLDKTVNRLAWSQYVILFLGFFLMIVSRMSAAA